MGAKNQKSQRVKARQIYEFIQENLYFNQPDLTIKQGNRIKKSGINALKNSKMC